MLIGGREWNSSRDSPDAFNCANSLREGKREEEEGQRGDRYRSMAENWVTVSIRSLASLARALIIRHYPGFDLHPDICRACPHNDRSRSRLPSARLRCGSVIYLNVPRAHHRCEISTANYRATTGSANRV